MLSESSLSKAVFTRRPRPDTSFAPIAAVTMGEWGDCLLCYSTCPAGKNSFFMHGVGNSWHGYDTMFLNFISCHP